MERPHQHHMYTGSASSSSDVVTGGRHRLWAAIQAGLRDLGVTPEGIRRCKQGLLHVPGMECTPPRMMFPSMHILMAYAAQCLPMLQGRFSPPLTK